MKKSSWQVSNKSMGFVCTLCLHTFLPFTSCIGYRESLRVMLVLSNLVQRAFPLMIKKNQ